MIFASFLSAVGQLGDRRFRRVVFLGILLSLVLLVAICALFLLAVRSLTPDTLDLPIIGPVTGIASFLGWTSVVAVIWLSTFLMVPVASVFIGFFLEPVVDAVEESHFPGLPPARVPPWHEALRQSVNFLGLVVAVNLLSLLVYPFVGPAIPLVFWSLNGLLLGREYFSLVASRRLPPADVKAMRQRNWLRLWAAGALMAAPLSIPILNLVIPVLGVATFTHLFHRLVKAGR